MTYVEYNSNNSGGHWWLKDEDWQKLESAGWEVDWVAKHETNPFGGPPEERWLGALAGKVTRRGLSMNDAIEEWESVVRQWAAEPGCRCCGQPHCFTSYSDDGELLDFGPSAEYEDDE